MGTAEKPSKTIKDGTNMKREARRSLNVNEEYLGALRTKSYVDFFLKAQLLVNNNQPSSPSQYTFSEILLEPGQETITSILESTNIFPGKYNLKSLLSNYFNISAQASKFCSHLLKSINQVQSDYTFVEQVFESIDDCSSSTDQHFGYLVLELRSFIIHNNPFSDLKKQDFTRINDEYSSILQHLKSKRKKVARKIKLIKGVNKASGVCVTAACGLVAVAAMVLAAHTVAAIIMGPAILSLPLNPIKKKITNLRFLKCGFLRKIGAQLDVAAKGTYILNRDFDTMSRLVDRLHDEIEHNKAMIQLCLDRREDSISLQVLKELKKSNVGFRKQVEELEEHVYLCLLTINRARALVIKEIAISCGSKINGNSQDNKTYV
ncbi:UPF0496 protein At1g20180-like isoform X1 [Nicotiana sylvestris]|uniref:UPF0496 protein At1g20180-like isoform X1 n=1 Tax=Nicotiana sylvestris TaxID=4096 RepID=A0A1U7V8D7_NICSY|nr:PREDICTED: UPF0496 protein At1g20180-like isoform X1 [Nicotiana sylvestris]XP_016485718.1 PREDICTED: UPF0496 protein At1g20180-like [Nicotiana tabacum]